MPLRITPYQQQVSPSGAAMPRASVPSLVDPTGAALADLAGQASKIGQDMFQVQREADLQDRIGKATAEIATAELEFERDTDFRTAPQRFQERAESIRDKYLDNVSDAVVATAFRKQFQQVALSKSLNVMKDSWKKEGDYNRASLDANLDTYATNAANAKNPAEAAIVENQARLALASAQKGGWITAEDAGKRERKFFEKRDTGVVIRDMSIDPSMTATKLSLDPSYAANVDPVQRERLVDQAYRRADTLQNQGDAAAVRARKARGDELLKDALGRQDKGVLTHGYVEQIKPFIEPAEYKSLLAGLKGADVKDDPAAFSELQGLVYSNPEMARDRAYALHAQRRIKNETLSSVLARSRDLSRTEGPRTAYERERLFITNAIKPSDMVPDPSGSARYALVIREYDDFAQAGQRTDAELRETANNLLKKYTMVDMIDLAQRTAAGAQPTPQLQLQALDVKDAQLVADLEAKRITKQQFDKKAEALNKARKAAEKAAQANGGK